LYIVDNDCKEFIIQNCLTPKISFKHKIENKKKELNLKDYCYSIIHIRVPDYQPFYSEQLKNIISVIDVIKDKITDDEKCVLLISNDVYFDHINYPFIIKTNLKRGHIGLNTTTIHETEDTMIEFMIMTTSKKIYQISELSWGSGFSDIVNKIYDIPLEDYKI